MPSSGRRSAPLVASPLGTRRASRREEILPYRLSHGISPSIFPTKQPPYRLTKKGRNQIRATRKNDQCPLPNIGKTVSPYASNVPANTDVRSPRNLAWQPGHYRSCGKRCKAYALPSTSIGGTPRTAIHEYSQYGHKSRSKTSSQLRAHQKDCKECVQV